AITRPVRRMKHRRLAVEAKDAAVHVRLLEQHAHIVDEVARREVVGAVDDYVVGPTEIHRVGTCDPRLIEIELHLRVDGAAAFLGGLQLGPADVGRSVQDLSLEIAEIDDVEIDKPDAANAGGGEVES